MQRLTNVQPNECEDTTAKAKECRKHIKGRGRMRGFLLICVVLFRQYELDHGYVAVSVPS